MKLTFPDCLSMVVAAGKTRCVSMSARILLVTGILGGFLSICTAAEPAVIWSVPSPAASKQDSRNQEIRLRWINDEELFALRRGGIVGKYHCEKKKTLWEKRFALVCGFAASPTAVYLIEEQDSAQFSRHLVEIGGGDGLAVRMWPQEKLGKYAHQDSLALHNLEWLPDPGLLAIESLQMNRSDAWFFDPRADAFRGKVNLGGYLWESSSDGKSLVWVHNGIIRQAKPGELEFAVVWDSGLGEGGDDHPGMRAYQVGTDGGFAAVLDNGGWQGGARLFHREGAAGKVEMATISHENESLHSVAVDMQHQRIWLSTGTTGWFGCFDFSGKLVASTDGLSAKNIWAIAVAPSGKRAAVVDSTGTLSFIELR